MLIAEEIMAKIDTWFASDVARNEAIMPGCTVGMSQAVAIGEDGNIRKGAECMGGKVLEFEHDILMRQSEVQGKAEQKVLSIETLSQNGQMTIEGHVDRLTSACQIIWMQKPCCLEMKSERYRNSMRIIKGAAARLQCISSFFSWEKPIRDLADHLPWYRCASKCMLCSGLISLYDIGKIEIFLMEKSGGSYDSFFTQDIRPKWPSCKKRSPAF